MKLVQQVQHVISVELDTHWYKYLQKKFRDAENLTLYHSDFLDFRLPSLPYKVFANIPFSIEGKIIRKLIDAQNPPEDCYLIMMKELAYRLAAPYHENMFSIMHKPWFEFSIYHHFQKTDFIPIPSVDVVMLRFIKRISPLLSWDEKIKYEEFIKVGFGQGQPVIQNFKKNYGKKKALYALKQLGIYKDIKPSFLSLEQWISLYKIMLHVDSVT